MFRTLPFLLCFTASAAGADADRDFVIGKIREHLEAIKSVHVRGVSRTVKAGGLWGSNPESDKVIYDPQGAVREFDVWYAPPKGREMMAETRTLPGGSRPTTTATMVCFDGATYTFLDLKEKCGLRVLEGASMVKPIAFSPVNAIGCCIMGTFQTPLTALLAEPSRVTVEQVSAGPPAEWLVQVKGIPTDIHTMFIADRVRQEFVTQIWVTIGADIAIRRWALWRQQPSDAKASAVYGLPLPSLHLGGYVLSLTFVNCDWKPAHDAASGGNRLMPHRILMGNGNAGSEFIIQEFVLNPRPTPDTFLPTIPAAYSITHHDRVSSGQPVISGGASGPANRIQQISQQARQMLATGEGVQADSTSLWTTLLPYLYALLVVSGVVIGVIVWRRLRG